jgi:hypothetical protein
MTRWRKLTVRQKEGPENACCNEVNVRLWVLCVSWPEALLFDARRRLCNADILLSLTHTFVSLPRVQLQEWLWHGLQMECHLHACGLSSVVRCHPRVSPVHRMTGRRAAEGSARDRQDVSNNTDPWLYATFTSKFVFVFVFRVGCNLLLNHLKQRIPKFSSTNPPPPPRRRNFV